MTQWYTFGGWEVEFQAEDGGRLSRLGFHGHDLLTSQLLPFRAPSKDFGLFETRPVYGYDDCFPSVDPCAYPTKDWQVPDHGELCWLKWEVSRISNSLEFQTRSLVLPICFQRTLIFEKSSLAWSFKVSNLGSDEIPFQHAMHPLMPLREISAVSLPHFSDFREEQRKEKLWLATPEEVESWLLNQPVGTAAMLYLEGISAGKMVLTVSSQLRVSVAFPVNLFPTLGIWWNNEGYPDEEGCRRVECAFEPIPGSNSRLSDAYQEGKCLSVKPHETVKWEILWSVEELG